FCLGALSLGVGAAHRGATRRIRATIRWRDFMEVTRSGGSFGAALRPPPPAMVTERRARGKRRDPRPDDERLLRRTGRPVPAAPAAARPRPRFGTRAGRRADGGRLPRCLRSDSGAAGLLGPRPPRLPDAGGVARAAAAGLRGAPALLRG